VGVASGGSVTTASNVICIGANVSGANVDGTCFIGSIRGVTTINNNAMPVLIDGAGQLGTANSSRRFKRDIRPIGTTSETILALKPVSFSYKAHNDNTPQFGLVAEDVARVNPNLVIYDEGGKPYAVRYDAVNAMLLNEFLKEHRAFVEQKRKVDQQQKEIDALKADLKEQNSRIQEVSDRIELKSSRPRQLAVNNQ